MVKVRSCVSNELDEGCYVEGVGWVSDDYGEGNWNYGDRGSEGY